MIDPSIALGVKPVQIDNPLNALAQMYQIKQAQQQGQLGDMAMQEKQRGMDESNKLRSLFATPGFDIQNPDSIKQVMAVSPTQGMAMQKSQLDNAKTNSDINSKNFETASKAHSIYQQTLGALAYSPNLTKDAVIKSGQAMVQAGIMRPEMLAPPESLPDDTAQLKDMLLTGVHAQLTPEQLMSHFAPKPTQINNGQQIGFRDMNPTSPTYGQATGGAPVQLQQSPESVASQASAAASRAQAERHFQVEQAANGKDEAMDPLAVRMTAQQYLAGDSGALSNFGRGAQGAQNLNAVRLEISKQAQAAGLSGADIAAKMAEFGGMKAGQRTAGTRSASIEIAANEAAQLAPLALDASQKVARSGLLPFGKAQIMFDSNTNDPALRQFAMANNALANAYGQVMSRGGVATVSDKEHAKELLSTAFDQPSYAAAVQQLQAEIKAAQKAPREVRDSLSREIGGKGSNGAAPAIPSGWSVKEH